MSSRGKFVDELSRDAEERLDAIHEYAVYRYSHYRARHALPGQAYAAALAWGRNVSEQRERDYAHDTGAVHWCV